MPDIPTNNTEQYLANIAGESAVLPDFPTNRVERYLAAIAANGSGGGGGSSDVFEVVATGTGSAYSDMTFTFSKTAAETLAAVESGKGVVLYVRASTSWPLYPTICYKDNEAYVFQVIAGHGYGQHAVEYYQYELSENGWRAFHPNSGSFYFLLPAYTGTEYPHGVPMVGVDDTLNIMPINYIVMLGYTLDTLISGCWSAASLNGNEFTGAAVVDDADTLGLAEAVLTEVEGNIANGRGVFACIEGTVDGIFPITGYASSNTVNNFKLLRFTAIGFEVGSLGDAVGSYSNTDFDITIMLKYDTSGNAPVAQYVVMSCTCTIKPATMLP